MPLVELPIFPLSLVLFPGVPQLLHIFEPRYREMLTDCLAGEQRFGISWVAATGADPDPSPAAGAVGCTAHIRARTALPDGRSNILTVGEARYWLREYLATGRPYRVARVETFDDDPSSVVGTEELAAEVARAFTQFSAALNALNDASAATPALPEEPKELSFQVAAAIELEARFKQELLSLRSTRARLEAEARVLRVTAGELSSRAEVHLRARRNGRGGAHPAIVKGA